jgi:hypothetical protein
MIDGAQTGFGPNVQAHRLFFLLSKKQYRAYNKPHKKEYFMRRIVIIAIIAVVGFSFVACGEPKEEKTIVVTDLEDYNGKYGYTGLGIYSSGKVVAVSLSKKISGGKLTLPLIDAKSYEPFDGTGTFVAIFTITETSDTDSTELFDGYIYPLSITEATTTLSLNDFTESK